MDCVFFIRIHWRITVYMNAETYTHMLTVAAVCTFRIQTIKLYESVLYLIWRIYSRVYLYSWKCNACVEQKQKCTNVEMWKSTDISYNFMRLNIGMADNYFVSWANMKNLLLRYLGTIWQLFAGKRRTERGRGRWR